MGAGDLYLWVLAGWDRGEAVASLSDQALCQLSGFLGQRYQENELTGEVLGICLVEQARRFAERVGNGRGQDVPATSGDKS